MALIEATIAGCYPLASNIPPHRKMLPEENLFELEDGLHEEWSQSISF